MSENIKNLENALKAVDKILFTTMEERLVSEIVIAGVERLRNSEKSCQDSIKFYINYYVEDYIVKCPHCLENFSVADGDIKRVEDVEEKKFID